MLIPFCMPLLKIHDTPLTWLYVCNINMTCKAPVSLTRFERTLILCVGHDDSVGIATCYGLDAPGIESRWGRDFPHLSRPSLGSIQPPGSGYRSFPG